MIKMIFKLLLKNPITEWGYWYLRTLKLLFGHRNKHLKIEYMAVVNNTQLGIYNTIYNYASVVASTVNDFSYIGPNTHVNNAEIGKFCSIGPNVRIGPGKHPTNMVSTFPAFFSVRGQGQIIFADSDGYFEETGKVKIKNDVWIGASAIIMDNITIGDGAIIAAGAVVTKDVPPYAIVGGVPAKVIKFRFSEDTIEQLLSSKWWDHDIEWYKLHWKEMHSAGAFLSKNNNN